MSGQYRGSMGGGRWHAEDDGRPAYQRTIPPPMGRLLSSVTHSQVIERDGEEVDATITNCHYVGSYNLMEKDHDIITTPGCPPIWSPPHPAPRLDQDSAIYFRDDNAARFPKHPSEPAVLSVLTYNPSFHCDSIDIFACAITLTNIVRFALGSHEPSSFLVELVGNTAFFLRRENSPTELIKGLRGFGHTFPAAYTTWEADVKGSVSHQRVVQYNLGGLNCLVRTKCDGYIRGDGEKSQTGVKEESRLEQATSSYETPVKETLADVLNTGGQAPSMHDHPIQLKVAGTVVPQSSVFDLKTRAAWKKGQDIINDELPRLWVRQVSKMIVAFHNRSLFENPTVQDVSNRIQSWEAESQTALLQAVDVLRKILTATKATQAGKIEVRLTNTRIELRELSMDECLEWNALATGLAELWADNTPVAETMVSP